MNKQIPLSDTARTILEAAVRHPNHLASPPAHLPAAAQRSAALSMIKAGLLEEVTAREAVASWRTSDSGVRYALRVTSAGLSAIGADNDLHSQEANAADVQTPTTPQVQTAPLSLKAAADALLGAWDATANGSPWLATHFDVLRAAVEASSRKDAARQPRSDTKRAKVVALLSRPEGATVAQISEATGWARHTVHGFLAGLKKTGTTVEVLERVRQVGPGKQGAAGSYTIYCIPGAV